MAPRPPLRRLSAQSQASVHPASRAEHALRLPACLRQLSRALSRSDPARFLELTSAALGGTRCSTASLRSCRAGRLSSCCRCTPSISTPADYGLLSLLDLSLEIALLMFSAGATAGLMRFYFKAQDPIGVESSVVYCLGLGNRALRIGSVLLFAVAPMFGLMV